MFIFLSKLLPLFVYPLGLVTLLLLLALLLPRRWAQRPLLMRLLLLIALLLLWLSSTAWVSMGLARSLEQQFRPPAEMPVAEVAVVLGGATRPPLPPRPMAEVRESGDRLLYAAQLYHQGKVRYLLLSGGTIAWLESDGSDPEAETMADLLVAMGVPRDALWLETASRNTYENALYTRPILEEAGVERVLLVTSALHMPRSMRIFARQGIDAIPAPTDFRVADAEWRYLREAPPAAQPFIWLPNVDSLELTTDALKEYIGIVVYRLRGWL